ncbi:TadE family protein [Massilia aquatica]|uniref:TadE family protein n=1 Tax=Massilia aquatica TaxID=2609000 RepID=UPI00141E27BA
MRATGAAGCARAQCGAATIEFYIIAFWVLVPMFMAILQLGLFMVAKNTANVATLAAARAGAASGLDMGEMRRAFALHIAPLYATSGLGRISDEGFVDAQSNYGSVASSAIARARLETEVARMHRITVLNPTTQSFDDFQITRASDKARIIPVDGLYANNAMGSKSQQQRSDALLLKIETRYCYKMIIPIIDRMIIKVLTSDMWSDPKLDHLKCYALNAIPILSQSVVRITVPPERSKLEN